MGDYGCDVFAFDPAMGKDDHNHTARVMFFNLGLSDVNQEANRNASSILDKSGWKTRTLATIIQELGHSEVTSNFQYFFLFLFKFRMEEYYVLMHSRDSVCIKKTV